jgi:DNA-binding transcriptional LysR family regulator
MDDPFDYLSTMAVFVKVVDAKGFTAAARHLGMTKSAVSKQVARLEHGLGVRLLHRTTRSLSLTDSGRVLYERATQSLALADEARAAVADLSAKPRGILRVTASVAFGKLCVAPLVPEFLARNPELRIQLILLDRFVDLAEEGIDLAIRLARVLPGGVVAKTLCSVDYALCASPTYLKTRKKIQQPADLAQHDCLYYGSAELGGTWTFERARKHQSVHVSGRFIVNSSEVIRDAVRSGLGIGLLPSFAVGEDLANERLIRVLPNWKPLGPFGDAAYAVWLPDRLLPPKVRAFVEFLDEKWSKSTKALASTKS